MPLLTDEPNLFAQLRGQYLFAGLDDSQYQRVRASAHACSLAPDESLFEQGQPADRFFLVRRGLLKLSRLSPAGDEKVIEFAQPGQTFAEALMFMGPNMSYPVTARAIESSTVLGFENRIFMDLLKESPDACLRVLAGISKRMHGLIEEIDRLALQSATRRLVEFLLGSAEKNRVELRTPKQVLASRLSIKPETLSRIFARLTSDGFIRVSGSQIELLRATELRGLMESVEI